MLVGPGLGAGKTPDWVYGFTEILTGGPTDGGEPQVAGPGVVVTVDFEMIEEAADHLEVQVLPVQGARL